MSPLRLPPVDSGARLTASPLGRALSSAAVREQAAAEWARLLECPIRIAALPPTQDARPGSARARAGLVLADGATGVLSVDTALLAGRIAHLAGAPARSMGPVPLSPAESGLFAYLAMTWCGCLTPPPAVDWIDGGAALAPIATPTAAIRWRVTVDGAVGLAHWWLPDQHPAAPALRADLPVTALLRAGRCALGRPPGPGDLVVLQTPATLSVGAIVHPLTRQDARWVVTSAQEARMTQPIAELPLTVDAVVGRLILTVADVSALAPGAVLPLGADPLPEVRLMVGDQPIAAGVLVDDAGRAAVQITRLLGQSSSRI